MDLFLLVLLPPLLCFVIAILTRRLPLQGQGGGVCAGVCTKASAAAQEGI